MASTQTGNEPVRLNFVGPQAGNVMYKGNKTGQEYIAGNNESGRVILADPSDVEHLLSLRNGGRPLFEVDEPEDKKAARQLKELQESAPEGMEWDAELKSYQPIGLRLVNGRWTPVGEIAANGLPEVDSNGLPIVDAAAAGELRSTGTPGPDDSAALATDEAAAKNSTDAAKLAAATDGAKSSDKKAK